MRPPSPTGSRGDAGTCSLDPGRAVVALGLARTEPVDALLDPLGHLRVPAGLGRVLVSPSRGLLIFCPVLVFTVPGVYLWLRRGRVFCRSVYVVSLLFVIFQTLLLSKYEIWWGGTAGGPVILPT